jgi:hypothetical protein
MAPRKILYVSVKMKRRSETNALMESESWAPNFFLKSNTSTSRDLDELALVLVEEQTNVDPEV